MYASKTEPNPMVPIYATLRGHWVYPPACFNSVFSVYGKSLIVCLSTLGVSSSPVVF